MEGGYFCFDCNSCFFDETAFSDHNQKMHLLQNHQHQCPRCRSMFAEEGALDWHWMVFGGNECIQEARTRALNHRSMIIEYAFRSRNEAADSADEEGVAADMAAGAAASANVAQEDDWPWEKLPSTWWLQGRGRPIWWYLHFLRRRD